MPNWTEICRSDELAAGQRRLFRRGKLALALFREADGGLHAVDNRCPHEGYPLLEGSCVDGVLTCPWHNFKFRLADGRCVQGDENLEPFAVREREDRIEVDLSPPDPLLGIPRRIEALEQATLDGRLGQVARELARCLEAGLSPSRLAVHAARLDARHAEFGSSHALPIAADLGPLLGEELDPLAALLLPFELVSEGHRRRPPHESVSMEGADDALAAHIESEDLPAAQASALLLLRRDGWPAVRGQLQAAACEHFLSFGHPMIYIEKLDELMPHCDPESAEEILMGLVRNFVTATREDMLPPMQKLRRHLGSDFPGVAEGHREPEALGDRSRKLSRAILAGDSAWIELMDDSLRARVRVGELIDVLVRCASERLWRFDPSLHDRADLQDGWLDVSHALSFAHALRPLFATNEDARSLRSLFHSAHFIARSARLDLPERPLVPAARPFDREEITASLRRRDIDAITASALGSMESRQLPALRAELLRWAFEESATRPIFVAHVVKMLRVAFEESEHLSDPLPLLATLRFAVEPKRERTAAQLAHDATQLVRHGRLPRRLSS